MKKYTVEYVFDKVSPAILWRCIATADGLGCWFADKVEQNGKDFTFIWKNHEQKARLLRRTDEEVVRFRWEDEPTSTYFEFAMHHVELTRDVALTITDFAEEDDIDDAIRLWNAQIDDLRRLAGM